MSGFNNNNRLQDHLMYSLDWAIFLRHNIEEQLLPFLFEWEGDTVYTSMLQPGGDPEEFAYRIAEKSKRNSDQFVIGYEGMLTDEGGNKMDAFIIKGYDKTQPTGVFLAQLFKAKEKNGQFELIDKPMLIGNPDLPFAINSNIEPNYNGEEIYASGMVVNNNDQVAILSHFNPAVVSSGIKNFLRSKLNGPEANSLSGNFEISIAPQETYGEFFKYTITRVIKEELNSDYSKNWELNNNKKINLVCKHGEDLIFQNSNNSQSETKTDQIDEHQTLVKKYQNLNQADLDKEFGRLVSIPNARTNIDCLKQMTALMEVYESKGFQMPQNRTSKDSNKSKSGCLSILLIGIISLVAFIIK
ncbi:MAG: hypothetical protein AB8F94_21895 [Saprospiraceae bacterium]